MSTENKLVKTAMDASVIVGLAAGVGYLGKKVVRENFLGDPSANLGNYGKWVVVLGTSLYLKQYLEDEKILPKQA